ncbi:alkaline phosphatase D family protein [Alienimonas californiensis]|uniref:Alkaline phosphatase D n=1 Tax=Alienimonas californiensis TaxID=2527989 RepID=A0A517P5F5_9PLAN|nr:alkaline phosphatase D family protein [Alienimonas californiensis]QDT14585.1 Alkaline phosphatase D precursor [Alienimonas californiensis]
MSHPHDRRSFVKWVSAAGGSALLVPGWGRTAEGAVRRRLAFADDPFTLGVASGDPAADGFVIWTRLAPQPLEGGGMPPELVEVRWEIAEDEAFSKPVQKGTAIATPQLGHSVHVEVEGLPPDRWYFYRFTVGDAVSPVGRARTFPAATALPDKFRFAFASCQHYETGYFTAYQHMLKDDLDAVVHLGDYFYEYAAAPNRARIHVGGEIESLDDYRTRHALYKTDPDLQAMHAACPWLVTWDDHEFDNNYAGGISEEDGIDPYRFLTRRAASYQAYYEHMPLRRSAVPRGPDMQLYRRVPFGRLAEFFVLDTRQYRSDQPAGDGLKAPGDESADPAGTLLGKQQHGWLAEGLLTSVSHWNVLAQQVMMAPVDREPGEGVKQSMDQWPGYDSERQGIADFLHERKIPNPVVLTGDIHKNFANELKLDHGDPDSPTVATEFVGTSITSGGNGSQLPRGGEELLAENPFVKFYNDERGYVRCEVTPEKWTTDYRVLEYVTQPGSPATTRASFTVESGRPGLQPT